MKGEGFAGSLFKPTTLDPLLCHECDDMAARRLKRSLQNMPVCNVGASFQIEDSQVGEVDPLHHSVVADVAVVRDIQLFQLRQ